MKNKMNYPPNLVSRIKQQIELSKKQSVNPIDAWEQWEQSDKWDQKVEWSEINAPPWEK